MHLLRVYAPSEAHTQGKCDKLNLDNHNNCFLSFIYIRMIFSSDIWVLAVIVIGMYIIFTTNDVIIFDTKINMNSNRNAYRKTSICW